MMTPKILTNQIGRTWRTPHPHLFSKLHLGAFSAVRSPLCSSTLLIPKVYPASAENVHGNRMMRTTVVAML